MRSFLSAVPLFPLVMGIVMVASASLAPAVGRRLGARTGVAFLLLASLGLVLTATLLPTSDAMAGFGSTGSCDLTRVGFPTISEVRVDSDTRLNLLLFLPFGLAIGLLPVGGASMALAGGALVLPFLVEGLQLTIPVLGRGCQTSDVVDNLAGLCVGLVVGLIARAAIGPRRLERGRDPTAVGR